MNKQIESAVVAEQSAEQFIKDLQVLHAGITDPLASQVLLKNIEQAVNLKRSVGLVRESLVEHAIAPVPSSTMKMR
jgi:hypothetical protein